MPNIIIRKYDYEQMNSEQLRDHLNKSLEDIKLSDLLFKEQEKEDAELRG